MITNVELDVGFLEFHMTFVIGLELPCNHIKLAQLQETIIAEFKTIEYTTHGFIKKIKTGNLCTCYDAHPDS